ncbi:very low-density lipoprotein receptor-like [Macrobrachium nipponense]|uniref:very low-density lipoprotein receptor-like n=1 Tax=Macrobrachium nipponense TaxID=159736 RepID=UPI0030C7B7F9
MRRKLYVLLLFLAVFDFPEGQCFENPECLWDNFMCQEGECIFESWVCDGRQDCNNNKDEERCGPPCELHFFGCNNGTCISQEKICNGHNDCSEGEDEASCGNICYGTEYQCSDGQCISGHSRVCDGKKDCRDGSDESRCEGSHKCRDSDFTCSNGTCIKKDWVCDGDKDCPNGEDEKNCTYPSTCAPDQVTCSDSRCAPSLLQCFTPLGASKNLTVSQQDESEQCLLVNGCLAKVIGLSLGVLGLILIIAGWSFWIYKEKVAQAGESNYLPLGRQAERNSSSEAFTMDDVP